MVDMNNYKTFDEMFNDDKIVSPEERLAPLGYTLSITPIENKQ